MNGRDILNKHAPQNHHHGQPPINRVSADEHHVERGQRIEHHRGRNIPKREFVVQPKVPVEGDVAHEVEPHPGVASMKPRNVVKASDNEPRGIDAQIATQEEMFERGIFHPRIPQAHATEKQKDVDANVTHAPKPKEQVVAGQTHVEKDDEKHGRSHQFAPVFRDIEEFDVVDFHSKGMRFMSSRKNQAKAKLATT